MNSPPALRRKMQAGVAKHWTSIAADLAFVVPFNAWFLAVAYGDWLRFSSPRAPDLVTGQVVYVKAAKGVFYATRAQAWWASGSAPLIFLLCVAGLLTGELVQRRKSSPARSGFPIERPSPTILLLGTTALLCLAFPDHVMALLMTGTLTVPPEPPPGLTVAPQ